MAKRLNHNLIFVLLLLPQCTTNPVSSDTEAESETDSIPVEIFKFYNNLNAEEKKQLKELSSDQSNTFSLNDNKFIDSVKETGAELALKLVGLRDIINSQLDGLQPAGREFVEEISRMFLSVFAQGGGIIDIFSRIKDLGGKIMEKFDRLPQTTRQDLTSAFPIITSLATNDIIRFFLGKIGEYDPSTKNFETPTERPESIRERPTKSYPTEDPQPPADNVQKSTIYPAVPSNDEDIEEPAVIKLTKSDI